MMKFKTKPVFVDVVRIADSTFDADHPNDEHVPGVTYDPRDRSAYFISGDGASLDRATIGDWIARSELGRLSILTNEAFEAAYAPAEPDALHLIDALRADEGAEVTICCDNPDFNGQPNCKVICVGPWTDWEEKHFGGDTVADALAAAKTAFDAKMKDLNDAG